MIKVDAKQRTVRETTAPYEHNVGGELKTDQIRIKYFSQTTFELKAERNQQVARNKELSDIADLAQTAEAAGRKAQAAERRAEKSLDDAELQAKAGKLREEADRLTKDAKARAMAAAEARDFPWLSHKLVKLLESLPDLADANGKPLPITIEALDTIAVVPNLLAIEKAIEEDTVPKEQPSK